MGERGMKTKRTVPVPFISKNTITQFPSGCGWTLRRPIELVIEASRSALVGPVAFMVSERLFGRMGVGATLEDAMEEYAYDLVGYWETLVEYEGVLAPHLIKQLDLLRTYIGEEASGADVPSSD